MKINRYLEIEKQFDQKNILVVGDIMLDNYLWGDVKRMSPEAPVPIVDIHESSSNPGGAANVASNLKSLGAKVSLAGAIGDDRDGNTLMELLKAKGINTTLCQTDSSHSTTVKNSYHRRRTTGCPSRLGESFRNKNRKSFDSTRSIKERDRTV